MNITYLGISSKYIHTMPAGWFLAEYLSSKGIYVNELYHNVNESYDKILNEVISNDIDVLLLSVYIFNVEFVKKLIYDIRQSRPNIKIIIGGPEADSSLDFDHLIIGEGEAALYNLIINGGDKIINEKPFDNLDCIPSPYKAERLEKSQNKLIYYESSRGCPYKCAYCMAGLTKGVRCFSLKRVFDDLNNIVNSGAKIIKFTDRTFNANTDRTNKILEYIYDNFKDCEVCFHFEVGGDLFTESTLKLLEKMPIGRIQMEAGVQTLNEKSLKAIDRVFRREVFESNILKIISFGNIHMHLDLIAGLPYDNMKTFIKSFDDVIRLRPHMLQLGFLKMLKRTPIRENYKAQFNTIAPYEIIKTPHMNEDNLKELKSVELILNKFYNSGKFTRTMQVINRGYESTYEMFHNIARFIKEKDYNLSDFNQIYQAILEFMNNDNKIRNILKLDYLSTNNSKILPKALKSKHSLDFKKFKKNHKNGKYLYYNELEYIDGMGFDKYYLEFNYKIKNPVTGQYLWKIVN